MNKFLDFTVLTFYCGLIYWLSDQQTLPMPNLLSFQDKIQHATAYFVMSLLAWRYLRHFIDSTRTVLLVSIIFCSVYGATDEWHQSYVIGRNSDSLDWLADTSGASLAMLALYYCKFKRLTQKFQPDGNENSP